MKKVRLGGIVISLALSFETMNPIKTLCTAWEEDKV